MTDCRQLRAGGFIASLLLLTACGLCAGGAAPSLGGPFAFRPGVVVDPARDAVYAMDTAGGVTAIRLSDGRPAWRNAAAVRALAVRGDELVVQLGPIEVSQLELGALPLDRPAVARRVARISLPEDVSPLAGPDPREYFGVEAVHSDEGLILQWAYERLPLRGLLPASQTAETVRREGVVRVRLPSGEVESASPEDWTAARQDDLPDSVRQALSAGRIAAPAYRVGDVYAAYERASEDGVPVVRLHRWHARTGEALEVVTLAQGARVTARYASADGRHLLVSGPAAGERWRWQVFDLAGGAEVAALDAEVPGAWFFVDEARGQLVCEQRSAVADAELVAPPNSLRLVARDLRSGDQRWAFELRDTRYRGILPPAREN